MADQEMVVDHSERSKVMADQANSDVALLLILFSPVFPVGGYAYSQGLEWMVASGKVHDAVTLAAWCNASLTVGALHQDLVLLSIAARAEGTAEFKKTCELAVALQPSRERFEETCQLGRAFLDAYASGWPEAQPAASTVETTPMPFPIAVAYVGRTHPIALAPLLRAFAVASLQNTVSAAIRLSVLGAFDGQRVLANQLPELDEICARALSTTEQDLGTCTMAADLASVHHEIQTTRLFRS